MRKASILARSAGSALAIAVAVPSTASLAQDTADPVPVVVATTPVSQPDPTVPTIVVPEVASVQAQTETETSPPPEASSSQTEAGRSSTNATAPTASATALQQSRVAARSPTAAPSETPSSSLAGVASGTVDASDVAGIEGAGGPSALPVVPAASGDEVAGVADDTSDASLVMGGGALALALGLVSLFVAGAKRRRRRQPADSRDQLAIAPTRPATDVADRVEPVAAAPLAQPGIFSLSHAVSRPFGASKWDDPMYVGTPAVTVSGRSVPDTPAGRKALIDRLVRATPDPTNPFRSPSARRRRARLIVQSLRHTMAQQPNLDFRRFYESFGRRKTSLA